MALQGRMTRLSNPGRRRYTRQAPSRKRDSALSVCQERHGGHECKSWLCRGEPRVLHHNLDAALDLERKRRAHRNSLPAVILERIEPNVIGAAGRAKRQENPHWFTILEISRQLQCGWLSANIKDTGRLMA